MIEQYLFLYVFSSVDSTPTTRSRRTLHTMDHQRVYAHGYKANYSLLRYRAVHQFLLSTSVSTYTYFYQAFIVEAALSGKTGLPHEGTSPVVFAVSPLSDASIIRRFISLSTIVLTVILAGLSAIAPRLRPSLGTNFRALHHIREKLSNSVTELSK